MKIKEEFKNLVPRLSQEEFKQLEENILEYGCREPICVWNDIIVDGHHRYEICTKHDLEYKTQILNFNDEEEVKIWIIKNQFGRRNLDAVQRCRLALQMEEMIKEKARRNQSLAGGDKRKALVPNLAQAIIENETSKINNFKTRDEIAKLANVSHGTLEKVKAIDKDAPKSIKEAMENNIISIDKAFKMKKQVENYPLEEQEERANEAIENIFKEEVRKIDYDYDIYKKLFNAFRAPTKIVEYLTDDNIDTYLNVGSGNDPDYEIERLDDAIDILVKAKELIKKYKSKKVVILNVKKQ